MNKSKENIPDYKNILMKNQENVNSTPIILYICGVKNKMNKYVRSFTTIRPYPD